MHCSIIVKLSIPPFDKHVEIIFIFNPLGLSYIMSQSQIGGVTWSLLVNERQPVRSSKPRFFPLSALCPWGNRSTFLNHSFFSKDLVFTSNRTARRTK